MDSSVLDIFLKYLIPFAPPQTLRKILEKMSDPKAKTEDLFRIIQANQAYEQFFLRQELLQERIAQWKEDENNNEQLNSILLLRSLRLFGKHAARNSIACFSLNRVMRVGLPRKETDKFFISARDQIRFALEAEEYCQDQSMRGTDEAYIAGLHFDWLLGLMVANKVPKTVFSYIDLVWKDAMKSAKIAYELGGQISAFPFCNYLFGCGLLIHLGKILMAAVFQSKSGEPLSWTKLLAASEKYKLNNDYAFSILESKWFSVSHSELSSLLVSFGNYYRHLESAICFYQHPEMVQGQDPNLYILASILHLASTALKGKSEEKSQQNDQNESDQLSWSQIQCLGTIHVEKSKYNRIIGELL